MTEAVRGGLLLSMVIGGMVMDCEKEEGREKEKEKSIGTQITVCFLFVNQKLVWFLPLCSSVTATGFCSECSCSQLGPSFNPLHS